MIDRFEAGFDTPPAQPAPLARTYDLVPRGTCRVEIVKAERQALPWRATTENPAGECIVLRLRAAAGYAFVFVDLPDDKPWLAQHVARAVGVASNAVEAEQLVGLHARVEIAHVTTRSGETRAVVRKWLPSTSTPQPAASKPATLTDAVDAWHRDDRQEQRQPRRAPPQQVKRSPNAVPQIGADDIPF